MALDAMLGVVGFKLFGGKFNQVAPAPQSAGNSNFNPFRGKTSQQIDEMFRAKGFEPRGPDPVNGMGGYVNPESGRSYHIDPANRFGEPPHVDVNRPRGYNGPLPDKRKFFLGD